MYFEAETSILLKKNVLLNEILSKLWFYYNSFTMK